MCVSENIFVQSLTYSAASFILTKGYTYKGNLYRLLNPRNYSNLSNIFKNDVGIPNKDYLVDFSINFLAFMVSKFVFKKIAFFILEKNPVNHTPRKKTLPQKKSSISNGLTFFAATAAAAIYLSITPRISTTAKEGYIGMMTSSILSAFFLYRS